jgi:predicted phosphodiesterase
LAATKPMTHIGKCGHVVTKPNVEKCRACWRARGDDVPADEKVLLGKCGHQISRKGRTTCRECYDKFRSGITPQPLNPVLSYEAAWQQWQKAIGQARDRYKGPKAKRKGVTQKILVVPDVHAPFHEEGMFADMLQREADADKVICIGDLSDSYALSTYTHYRRMPFAEEWASVTLCMQAMSESFPEVEIVVGNHDARLEKRLRERLSEDMVDAVKYLSGGVLCPITALAKHYPNVHVANHRVPGGDSVDWFTTCGDAWLGHPEKYSRTPGAALRFVDEWLNDNEYALGLNRYRLVVLGHTHTYSQFLWRAGTMLIECGCLAQTDGITDLNSVRFVWLDAAEQVA